MDSFLRDIADIVLEIGTELFESIYSEINYEVLENMAESVVSKIKEGSGKLLDVCLNVKDESKRDGIIKGRVEFIICTDDIVLQYINSERLEKVIKYYKAHVDINLNSKYIVDACSSLGMDINDENDFKKVTHVTNEIQGHIGTESSLKYLNNCVSSCLNEENRSYRMYNSVKRKVFIAEITSQTLRMNNESESIIESLDVRENICKELVIEKNEELNKSGAINMFKLSSKSIANVFFSKNNEENSTALIDREFQSEIQTKEEYKKVFDSAPNGLYENIKFGMYYFYKGILNASYKMLGLAYNGDYDVANSNFKKERALISSEIEKEKKYIASNHNLKDRLLDDNSVVNKYSTVMGVSRYYAEDIQLCMEQQLFECDIDITYKDAIEHAIKTISNKTFKGISESLIKNKDAYYLQYKNVDPYYFILKLAVQVRSIQIIDDLIYTMDQYIENNKLKNLAEKIENREIWSEMLCLICDTVEEPNEIKNQVSSNVDKLFERDFTVDVKSKIYREEYMRINRIKNEITSFESKWCKGVEKGMNRMKMLERCKDYREKYEYRRQCYELNGEFNSGVKSFSPYWK